MGTTAPRLVAMDISTAAPTATDRQLRHIGTGHPRQKNAAGPLGVRREQAYTTGFRLTVAGSSALWLPAEGLATGVLNTSGRCGNQTVKLSLVTPPQPPVVANLP